MARDACRVGDPLDDVLDAVDGDRADRLARLGSRSVSPAASDRPQTGERLASVARGQVESVGRAFGVVRSCGSTPPAPSSTTSRPPSTPTVSRAVPARR